MSEIKPTEADVKDVAQKLDAFTAKLSVEQQALLEGALGVPDGAPPRGGGRSHEAHVQSSLLDEYHRILQRIFGDQKWLKYPRINPNPPDPAP